MPKITYKTNDDKTHTIDVENGLTVMEGAVQNDIPGIDADCGGGMSCATCHVYVNEEWLDKRPKKEDGVKSFYWDWTSENNFNFKGIMFDSIILIPKPSNMNEDGYRIGFIKALAHINNSPLFLR